MFRSVARKNVWLSFMAACSLLLSVQLVMAQEPDILELLINDNSYNFLHPEQRLPDKLATKAEPLYRRNLQQAKSADDDEKILFAASRLGWIILQKGDAAKALSYFQEGIAAAARLKKTEARALLHLQCGIAQQQLQKYQDASISYGEADQLTDPEEQPRIHAWLLAKQGECQVALKQPDLAEAYFLRAAKIYANKNHVLPAAVCLKGAGEAQLRKNEYIRAKESFEAAIRSIQPNKERELLAQLYRDLGLVDFKRNDFEAAIAGFNKSLGYDNQLLVHKLLKDAYLQAFTLYSFKDNFKKADFYHEKYRTLKDSLDVLPEIAGNKPDAQRALAEKEYIIELLQKQYEDVSSRSQSQQLELSSIITKTDLELQQKELALEEKTAELEVLTKEKAVRERDLARKELLITKQQHTRNILLAIAAFALILLFFMFNGYKSKKKSNQRLKATNSELEQTLQQLRATQDKLIQSEKMASLGQLTAGIAHEIQNPLNFVNNFSEGATELMDELSTINDPVEKEELMADLRESLQKIHHHGKRAEKIVKSMLQHSRQGSGEKELTDLNQLLRDAVHLAYHGTRATYKDFQCTIEETLASDLPKIAVVPQDLNRVFLNIANNAFYAMREATLASPGRKNIFSISSTSENSTVVLHLRDNGTGIPKEVAARIFQPFFTTKPTGQGTGLGLSMCYDIVTKIHQGSIELESVENEYSLFTIHLPTTN